MRRTLHIFSFIATLFLVSSCFKEDEKVLPHEPGENQIDTIALTALYKNQVYFDLEKGDAILTNLRKTWDLSFESASEGYRIRLNTSCFMVAAQIEGTFGLPADTTGAIWKFDHSNGSPDSTAIGNWFLVQASDTSFPGSFYVINRGIDENGNDRGYRQLVLDSLKNDTYYFRMARFNGSDIQNCIVTKDERFDRQLFSFDSGIQPPDEPLSATWDLLFTQYTTLLYTDEGDPYPYLVTGVLLNPVAVEAALDSSAAFNDISFENASALPFSRQQDFIGYDWKYYDFDEGFYTVDINKIYIIRNRNGLLFKLRFLGFYNMKGEKGYPSIEYQRL